MTLQVGTHWDGMPSGSQQACLPSKKARQSSRFGELGLGFRASGPEAGAGPLGGIPKP